MAGFLCNKVKRKDFEEIYDDFSEFSLSSPARKIRRLDAELAPIMEDEELPGPIAFDQMLPEAAAAAAAAAPCLPLNEERALVLYKPPMDNNTPLFKSPTSPNLTITVNSDLIPGFKSYLSGGDRSMMKPAENEYESRNRNCLAMVPWVSSQSQFPTTVSGLTEVAATAPMEAEEEVENEGLMEIDMVGNPEGQANGIGGGFGEAQQWKQQQHCMTPELPQNTSTPIMWSW